MSYILEIRAFISCIYIKTIVMDIAIYCRKWRGSQLENKRLLEKIEEENCENGKSRNVTKGFFIVCL